MKAHWVGWRKWSINSDQFLSLLPFEQLDILKQNYPNVKQVGPWALLGKPNVRRAGQTWKTTKSENWTVDFDDWGFPIFDKYAVATIKLSDEETNGKLRNQHIQSANIRFSINEAEPGHSISSDELNKLIKEAKAGNLRDYTWHHDGHEYGRMLLLPKDIHDAFVHTGWCAVLGIIKNEKAVFTKQRNLGEPWIHTQAGSLLQQLKDDIPMTTLPYNLRERKNNNNIPKHSYNLRKRENNITYSKASRQSSSNEKQYKKSVGKTTTRKKAKH